MMRFPRTFPKAVLIFVLVATTLFISVQLVSAAPAPTPDVAPPTLPPSSFDIPFIGNAFSRALESFVGFIVNIINGVVLFIAGVFVWFAGTLIEIALDLSSGIGGPDDRIVPYGYKIVLGITNMGFIISLVVIAFATMLRQESFGYKKALPKLIIAALLINFSFFIVTNVFLEPVNKVTAALQSASNFDPSSSFGVFSHVGDLWKEAGGHGWGGTLQSVGVDIASVIFTAIFSFLLILTLFAFAAMLFVRYIALAILVILMPLAWLGLIFPNLKVPGGGNPWSEWWQNFTRWLLFAPVAMFFFFLAIRLATGTDGAGGAFVPPPDQDFIKYLGGTVAVAGLLLGGLIAANKMGISGGAMALGAVAKMRGWAQVQTKELGRKYGLGAYKGVRGDEAAKRLQTVGAERGRFGKFATGWIRAAGRETTRTATGAERARQEFLKKKFESLAPFQVADMYAGLNDEEKMAAVQHMVDKGYQWELPEQWTKDLARWQRENLFNKRGRKKLELDAFDKGYSAEVLAAIEDEEAITAIADPAERVREATKRHFSDDDLKQLTDEELQARTAGAMEKTIRILGHKGIPNIDPRIISGESYGFRKRDPKTGKLTKEVTPIGERYQNLYVDSVLEHMPTAAAALYGRTRGNGATFMVEKTEEWLEKWNEDYLIPKLPEIAAQEGITEDEARKRIQAADQKKKIEWVDAFWDDKRKANLAATQLGAYMQTGRRAMFFPTIGGGEAPAPPA